MSPPNGDDRRDCAPPAVDEGHLSKGPNAQDATTLLVAHVEGWCRPRAMALSPDAVLRVLSQSRGGIVHLAVARDIPEATARVRQFAAWQDTVDGHTAGGTAPHPAGVTAPHPSDVTRTGGTAV